MRQRQKEATNLLNSWKEIAVFLNRGVRTVQRWERDQKLPIHRMGKGPRSPVFAYTSEINLWLHSFSARPERRGSDGAPPELALRSRNSGLLMQSRTLSRNLVRLTNEQRQRILKLLETVEKISAQQRRRK